jgi:hypothetical protein
MSERGPVSTAENIDRPAIGVVGGVDDELIVEGEPRRATAPLEVSQCSTHATGHQPIHCGFRFIRLTTTATTNTTRPTMRPRTIAVIVPEAKPISQPPASAGVPHCGFLLFPKRMAQNTVSGIATATKRAARQPIPKPLEPGFGFGLSDWYVIARPRFASRKRRVRSSRQSFDQSGNIAWSGDGEALLRRRHDDEIAGV